MTLSQVFIFRTERETRDGIGQANGIMLGWMIGNAEKIWRTGNMKEICARTTLRDLMQSKTCFSQERGGVLTRLYMIQPRHEHSSPMSEPYHFHGERFLFNDGQFRPNDFERVQDDSARASVLFCDTMLGPAKVFRARG